MTTRKSPLRRIAAAASALALVGASAVAFSAPAAAEHIPTPPIVYTGDFPVPDSGAATSLTVQKHVENGSQPGHPTGAALAGVEFSYQRVGFLNSGTCEVVDLYSIAGWEKANQVISAFNVGTGTIGAPGCLLDVTATAFTNTTNTSGIATQNGLKGLYYITETDPGANLISESAVPFLASVPTPNADGTWNYNPVAYPKNTLTTVTPTKTVGDTNVAGSVVPGAVVPWTITVPIPVAAFPYSAIEVTDTPSAGHTFTAWTSVSLNGTPLEAADYDATGNPLKLTKLGRDKVNALVTGPDAAVATLTVGLTTTVNADVTPSTLTNQASINLNGVSTPTTVPKSYWGKVIVTKHVNGDVTKTLAGAKFNIYAQGAAATCEAAISGGATVVANGTTDANGVFSQVLWIANAQANDASTKTKAYCLVETEAPVGYILDSNPKPFTLSTNNENFTTTVMFPNVKPSSAQLPLTGAGGTLAMTVSGLVLVGAGAGAIAVSRRRSHKA